MTEDWLADHEDELINEVARHEGLGGLPAPPCCDTCSAPNALYQCLDSLHQELFCQLCIVAAHESSILHCIQVIHYPVSLTNISEMDWGVLRPGFSF